MAIFNSYVSLPEGIYWCMIGVWLFSKITRDAPNGWDGVFERDFPWLRPLWFFTNYTNWVNVDIANWRITIFKFGKSTISIRAMFQFANCHSHYQRLYQLSNWSWWIIPSYNKKHRHVGQKLYTRWTYSELIFIYIHSWLVVWNMAFIFPYFPQELGWWSNLTN